MFSVFDPATCSKVLSLNWLSLVFVLVLPSSFWLLKSKWANTLSFLMLMFSKEIKAIFNNSYSSSMSLFLLAFFINIWISNLGGLLPYVFTPTSHLSVTLSLALPFWVGYFILNFFSNTSLAVAHLVPKGTPTPLVPFMVLIELVSSFMRPLTLSIRLAANMVAGHLLLSLLSSPMTSISYLGYPLVFIGLIVLMVLEMSVSFIQGYVFMTLSSLYLSEINNPNN